MSQWPKVKLGQCIERIRAGVSISGDPRPPMDGEVGILTLGAVSTGRFDPNACKAVPAAMTVSLGPSVRQGTLLMSRSNTVDLVGATVFVDRDFPDRYLPDLLWEVTLRTDSPLDPRFLADYLATPAGRRAIQSAAMGTSGSMKKLSMSRLRRLEVPRIPRQLQETWITFREQSESVIGTISELIAAKRKFKRGLMQELLTGRRRFPEFASEPWIEARLGELFSERSETGFEHLPLLAVTGDRGVVLRDELDRRDTSSNDKSKYKRVCPGDIAYNTMRMWQGVSGLSKYEGIVSPAYTVVTPTGPMMGRYARHLFKLPRIVHSFWRHSQGLVDDTLSLKFPRFATIRVMFPLRLDEQERIANVLDTIDREIELLIQIRAAYANQKRGLMQKLLTGELAIPVSSEPEPVHA